MQKIHHHGANDTRYFWSVKLSDGTNGEYRSRHSTPSGVKAEFKRNGQKVVRISAVKSGRR